ncbi:surface-adhesin E family protein [Pantanalinema rosaneae CENA516]|uniref:surface-adhesin E family protein n=1 Tax=Pantanalinema rosaneae TaxID=1620701 RepID=UPI003D6EB36F
MNRLMMALGTALVVLQTPAVLAAEWVNVAKNSVGDSFSIDKSAIQRNGDIVRYWEFREFPQPNNAFLEETVEQPVHGVVIGWSADCTSMVQRLRQVTAYDKNRQLIQRFTYGDAGSLAQPKTGSSAHTALKYVCEFKP